MRYGGRTSTESTTPLARRHSTSTTSSIVPSSYPYRQSYLEIRNGREYMTMLPPMTTEEDLLQEDLIGQPAVYTSYGPFPERRKRMNIVQAIADFIRKLRKSLGRRRPQSDVA
ncbi:hypothetical protein GSI_08811 [Ganoderma sinense ZZ0214-1]|uniref:Uncharacterized protein n=1 Tax=Ganoderma sinense ZZ0214-1 TaxID=1077348 RepID=A0A2G8S4W1_9APHY|nr:hypothetical protein GSI_08811 [Ganoderma sinense ZZ0214-1]